MSLFRRRKGADPAATAPTDAPDEGGAAREDDDAEATAREDDDAEATAQVGDDAEATAGAGAVPSGARGPFDVDDVPDLGGRVDLGALRVPARAAMQLRLEVEKKSRQVVAVTLGLEGSAMQLQVFAAPRTLGIWEELREEIAASVAKQGGTSQVQDGPFGAELLARLPVKAPDGTTGLRPARFVGVDGPRWFLRGVITGKAAVDTAAAAVLEDVFADVVVVRGAEARAPRDVLMLQAPGRQGSPEPVVEQEPTLDVMRRGPEITETR